jgi:hypothetical protein
MISHTTIAFAKNNTSLTRLASSASTTAKSPITNFRLIWVSEIYFDSCACKSPRIACIFPAVPLVVAYATYAVPRVVRTGAWPKICYGV